MIYTKNKQVKPFILLCFISFTFFYGCKKSEIDTSPETISSNEAKKAVRLIGSSITTLEVVNKTRTAAIICGQFSDSVDFSKVKEYGICYNTTPNPNVHHIKIAAADVDTTDEYGLFGVFLDRLQASTTYYARTYAISTDDKVCYGESQSFVTTAIPETEPLTWRWSSNSAGAIEAGHYDAITQAMDSAMYYYSNYSNLGDWIGVEYNPSVPTADCNSEGWMRFGANPRYHWVGTAQHEIAHALGVGTSSNWRTLIQYSGSRRWSGVWAKRTLRVMMKDMTQILKGDGLHFWNGGINQREEVTNGTVNSYGEIIANADMLKLNAMVLNAMRIDGLAAN
jgi:hypothetical protein